MSFIVEGSRGTGCQGIEALGQGLKSEDIIATMNKKMNITLCAPALFVDRR